MNAAERDAYVAAVLSKAPSLRADQLARLTVLLRPAASSTKDTPATAPPQRNAA